MTVFLPSSKEKQDHQEQAQILLLVLLLLSAMKEVNMIYQSTC